MAKKPKTPTPAKEGKGLRCFRAVGNPLYAYSQAQAIKNMLPTDGQEGPGVLITAVRERLAGLVKKTAARFKQTGTGLAPTVVTLCQRNGRAYQKHLKQALIYLAPQMPVVHVSRELDQAMLEAQKCAGTALEFCCIPLKPGRLQELRAMARKKK